MSERSFTVQEGSGRLPAALEEKINQAFAKVAACRTQPFGLPQGKAFSAARRYFEAKLPESYIFMLSRPSRPQESLELPLSEILKALVCLQGLTYVPELNRAWWQELYRINSSRAAELKKNAKMFRQHNDFPRLKFDYRLSFGGVLTFKDGRQLPLLSPVFSWRSQDYTAAFADLYRCLDTLCRSREVLPPLPGNWLNNARSVLSLIREQSRPAPAL